MTLLLAVLCALNFVFFIRSEYKAAVEMYEDYERDWGRMQ